MRLFVVVVVVVVGVWCLYVGIQALMHNLPYVCLYPCDGYTMLMLWPVTGNLYKRLKANQNCLWQKFNLKLQKCKCIVSFYCRHINERWNMTFSACVKSELRYRTSDLQSSVLYRWSAHKEISGNISRSFISWHAHWNLHEFWSHFCQLATSSTQNRESYFFNQIHYIFLLKGRR